MEPVDCIPVFAFTEAYPFGTLPVFLKLIFSFQEINIDNFHSPLMREVKGKSFLWKGRIDNLFRDMVWEVQPRSFAWKILYLRSIFILKYLLPRCEYSFIKSYLYGFWDMSVRGTRRSRLLWLTTNWELDLQKLGTEYFEETEEKIVPSGGDKDILINRKVGGHPQ